MSDSGAFYAFFLWKVILPNVLFSDFWAQYFFGMIRSSCFKNWFFHPKRQIIYWTSCQKSLEQILLFQNYLVYEKFKKYILKINIKMIIQLGVPIAIFLKSFEIILIIHIQWGFLRHTRYIPSSTIPQIHITKVPLFSAWYRVTIVGF